MDKEPIAKLIEHHRLDCMRMLHGQCSTRRCLVRGGWTPGDASGYSKATCEALETCRVLETLEAQLGGHALTAKEATANLLRASASEAAREAAEAKAARLEEALTWRATHRHVKRGTEYMLDSYGEIQTDTPLGDYAKVAIYKARDGKTWVRSLSEFEDGRFAALEAK